MKILVNLKLRFHGLLITIIRFPLTILLLTAAAIFNAVSISSHVSEVVGKLIITLYFGSLLSAVLQLLYERFFRKHFIRILSFGITIVMCGIFYLLLSFVKEGIATQMRIGIIFFVLIIGFLWVPAIKSRIDFNDSFMAVFKGFFATGFFTGILYLGIVIIIGAMDLLIVNVPTNAYMQSGNIVFLLLAPVYFQSLIPVYSVHTQEERPEEEDKILKAITPARFLEALVSFIVIPITVVFTIILMVYIVIHIFGDFWTNNLVEPLLISYSITVIIVYLLASHMTGVLAKYFRLIFPKILIPVVLFQTISSVIRGLQDGITYDRYYVILFGTFAVITGIIFSTLPVKKNGVIAPVLIIMSLISVIPPIDAFTVSRVNQINRLELVLKSNEMLQGGTITPRENISKKDQETIITSLNYLDRMGETKKVSWLSGYLDTENFVKTFGFDRYESDKNEFKNVYVQRADNTPIEVNGYDYLIHQNLTSDTDNYSNYQYNVDNKSYQFKITKGENDNPVMHLTLDGQEVLQFDTADIFNQYIDSASTNITKDTKELTYTKQNDAATITVIIQSLSISGGSHGFYRYADAYILVDIK